jgi:hypothetical protein
MSALVRNCQFSTGTRLNYFDECDLLTHQKNPTSFSAQRPSNLSTDLLRNPNGNPASGVVCFILAILVSKNAREKTKSELLAKKCAGRCQIM